MMLPEFNNLITSLGGYYAVSQAVGIREMAVRLWWNQRIGINERHWPILISLGKKRGIDITPDYLYRLNLKIRSTSIE